MPFTGDGDPLHVALQHVLDRVPPELEVFRLPMRLRRGLVANDLEVGETMGSVRVGQDMKLEGAWLIPDGASRFSDGFLPESMDVLRLDGDNAKDRVQAAPLPGALTVFHQRQIEKP